MTGRKRGPASKMTPDLVSAFCRDIELGTSIEGACSGVGIGRRTLRDWIAKGQKANEEGREDVYTAFLEQYEKALSACERRSVAIINNAARDSYEEKVEDGMKIRGKLVRAGQWTAAAWLLERRFAERWGRHLLELSGRGGGPLKIEEIQEQMRRDADLADETADADGGGTLDE